MLKKMLEIMMVAIIVAGAAGAYFKWIGALPISVTQTQKMSTFDATGEGKVVVVPDQAVLSMGVQEEGLNLKQVQEAVNKKMASLTKSLKEMGINEKDIKTTGYNYYPDYNNKNLYRAYANVSVVVRDLEQVSPVMDLIGKLGLDDVSGPTFGLSDELMNKTVKEARSLAIDKAKAKAEELAGLAGMRLGRIVNVVEGSNRSPNYLMREALPITGGGDMNAKTATPIEPGSSEVSVSVTLSYETN
ncbi:MAG: SIMPL domain-containing protein [bacterium]